jgi:dienelactone hydrolase
LDRIVRDYRIDEQRVYVTGHSMGGRGALYFAYTLPTRFAAVLALSPHSPITAWGGKLAKIPFWVFQGTADTFAPIADTKELVRAIQSTGAIILFWTSMTARMFTSGFCSRGEPPQLPCGHQRSNQSMELTATRCAFTFPVTKTSSLRLTLVLGRRSSLSR